MTSQNFSFDQSAIVDPSANVFGFILFYKSRSLHWFQGGLLVAYRQQIVEGIS